ncbi:hypothetical protein PVIIG_06222 [Plasmodium vivax India VII]|uniref:VIR protein n=1 Tax=Plasmodium vivax India VII TaxID=1077284 RepID=A0A0J9S2S4_PLAVI|nr:hypothetical protein PVIIG_06222 [Plasmodium vivax India VII]
MYDTLDKDVSNEDGNQDILSSCDRENAFNANPTIEKRKTCKKLLRNLLLCKGLNSGNFIKCCSDLYVWLYFEIKKYKLSNDNIKNIFTIPNLRGYQVTKPHCCPYFSFNDNLHKPDELLKVRVFNDNVEKFHNLLNNTEYSRNCFFKRYFYECVNTYIDLNGQFCSEDKKDISSNKDTCKILRDFSSLYTTFRQMANSKGYELTDLYSSKPYHVVSCTSEVTNLESSSTASKNSDKSIQHSFTPVGTMFRSKNKKSVNVFNHLDEEIEKELFYPRSKNGIINSSNARYSVAYEPV